MNDPKDLLMSALLPIDMLDKDNDITQSQVVGDSIVQYDFLQIIENIGKEEFKSTYLNFINDIRNQSLDNQRILCQHIIDKVQEVYKFEFPEKISTYDKSDIEEIYRFIEFLEYDNVDYIIEVIGTLKLNFFDSAMELIDHKKEILERVHTKIDIPNIFNNMVITLEPDILINLIISMFGKNEQLISNEIKIRKLQQIENKEE